MEVDEQREPAETGSFMQRLFRLGRSAPSTAAAVDNKPEPARSSDNDDSDSEIVFNTRQYRPEGNSDPINTHEAERTHTVQTALHVPSKTRTDTPYYHNVRRSTPKQLSNLAEASHDLPPIDAMSPIENAEAAAHLLGEGDDDMSPELVRQQRVTFGGVYEHERPITPTGRYAKKAAGAGYQPPVQLYDQYGTPVRVTSHGVEPMTHDSYGSTMSTPSRSSTNSTDGQFNVSSGYDADRSESRSPERRRGELPFSNKDKRWQTPANDGKKAYVSKLRYFDGKDWEAYKLHFLSCQVSNRWGDDEAAAILTSHLIGDAAFALTHVPAQERTLSALLNVLDERYDLVGPDYIIKGKLRRTVQRNNQSLQTFADSIMRVTWSSYGEQGASMALEQFIQGLADPRMQKHVAKRQPKSLPEALSVARQFEETESWVQTAHRPSRRIARVENKQADDSSDDDEHTPSNRNPKQAIKTTRFSDKQEGGEKPGADLVVMLKQIQDKVSRLEQSSVVNNADRFRGAGGDFNPSRNSAWSVERHPGSGDWRQPPFNQFRGNSNFRGRWAPRGRGFVQNNVYRQVGRQDEPDPRVIPGQRAIEPPPQK